MYGSRNTDQVAYWSAMRAGGSLLFTSWKLWTARPICLRLLLHCVRAAASRTFCTAGTSNPIRMAMMAITTKSSIRVKPPLRGIFPTIRTPLGQNENEGAGRSAPTKRGAELFRGERNLAAEDGTSRTGDGWTISQYCPPPAQ